MAATVPVEIAGGDAGQGSAVRPLLDADVPYIFYQQGWIAEHWLAPGKGSMVVDPARHGNLCRGERAAELARSAVGAG